MTVPDPDPDLPPEPGRRPLLVTCDDGLVDRVLHLAAACDVEVRVVPDLPAARESWVSAPLVVVGADAWEPTLVDRVPAGSGGPESVVVVAAGWSQPSEPAYPALAEEVADAGLRLLSLPADQDDLVRRLVSAGHPVAGGSGATVLAVLGGCGGAGASTLACALAVTAAGQGRRVVLVDADPLGAGIDVTVGAEDAPGLRWRDLEHLHGPVAPRLLRDALPVAHGVRMLSHDGIRTGSPSPAPSVAAMRAVLDAAGAGHDLLVADLCRHLDPAAEVLLAAADRTVLVAPADVRSAAAAARVAASVRAMTADLGLVVRGPRPAGLTGQDVAGLAGVPLLGWLRPEPGLPRALELGLPPAHAGRGPLADLSRLLLADLCGPAGRAGRAGGRTRPRGPRAASRRRRPAASRRRSAA